MQRRELSFGELVEGAIAAGDNATKLSHDARILIGRNRPATALALGIASLEEWGKSFQLIVSANMVTQGIPIEWNEFWESLYNHRPKQFLASVLDMILFGKEAVDLMMRTVVLRDLEDLRAEALYVDLVKSGWRHARMINRRWAWEILDACESISDEMGVSLRKVDALRVAKEAAAPPDEDGKLAIQTMQRNFIDAAQAADRKLLQLQETFLGPQARAG